MAKQRDTLLKLAEQKAATGFVAQFNMSDKAIQNTK